jgi:hypothetical protein
MMDKEGQKGELMEAKDWEGLGHWLSCTAGLRHQIKIALVSENMR